MQRQRSELVPISESLADLPGNVQAIRDDSPQGQFCRPIAVFPLLPITRNLVFVATWVIPPRGSRFALTNL